VNINRSVIILLIVITVYSAVCLTSHGHARLTADSMLYFSIAQKYLNGNFHDAINGYWGPLLAWLLVPFLHFGISDVLSINLLDMFIGVLTVIGVWILSFRFEITGKIRAVLLICLLPIVLKFSLVQPMDFILLCLLVYYLSAVFHGDYHRKLRYGVSSGILGALAYLTKAYAFPFFIVHFFIMNIFHYFKNVTKKERIHVVKSAIAGFLIFFVISGSWIILISEKYGHPTFSTMRDTNFNAPGPGAMGGGLEFGVPVFYKGFFAPPNDTAFVVWEDPSYLRGNPWSPWQSWTHFKHFIRLLLKNISDGLKIYEGFSTLSIAIIIAYLLFLSTAPFRIWLSRCDVLYPLFTLMLFSGGYVLFHVEERYLWLVNVLLLIMGGHVLSRIYREEFFKSNVKKSIILVFFVISFIFVPTKYIIQVGRGGMDTDMYDISTDLKQLGIRGNFASNREYVPVHDAWHKTFRLAYWLNSRYYGQAKTGIDGNELEGELKKYNIDYYFVWDDGNAVPAFLARHEEVTNNEIPGLKIYSLKTRSEGSLSD
jgi:hypothetical protein